MNTPAPSSTDNAFGVRVEVAYRDDDGQPATRIAEFTAGSIDELNAALEDLGSEVEEMELVELLGEARPEDLGFSGQPDQYIEPCFCGPRDWCGHNLFG